MTPEERSWKKTAIKLGKSQYKLGKRQYQYITEIDEFLYEADSLKDWKQVMKARQYIRKLIREGKI